MKVFRVLPALLLSLFHKGPEAVAQSCDMVQAVVRYYYPDGPEQFYVCNKLPAVLKTVDVKLMKNILLEYKFSAAESDSLIDFVMGSDMSIKEHSCGKPVKNVDFDKAERIIDKIEEKGDSYRLHRQRYDLNVYYLSAPAFYKNYAVMLCCERTFKTFTYYRIFLFERKNDKWAIKCFLDDGMISFPR